MPFRPVIVPGLLALLLLASCAEEPANQDPGQINVAYRFEGVEIPTRVNLYLIASDQAPDCESATDHASELASFVKRSLPVTWPLSDGIVFEDLDAESSWVLYGVGINSSTEVAFGCADGLAVEGDTVTYAELVLRNAPMSVAGEYTAVSDIDLGLVRGGTVTDALFEALATAVCDLLEDCETPDGATTDLVSALLVEYSNLQIQSRWTLAQRDDLLTGEMVWTHVQGVPVGDWDLVAGSFAGEIPGSTQMLLTSQDLVIDLQELTRFLLQEVLKEDLDTVPAELEEFLGPMPIRDGLAEGIDVDFDRDADRVHGVFFSTLGFGSQGLVYGVPLEWTLYRVDGSTSGAN